MDYYIQGDAARAKEIKAAFEAKGCTLYRLASNCDSEDLIYYSLNGIVRGIKKDNLYLFEAHPGYKELELPVEPKFKKGDWIACDADSFTLSIKSVKDGNYFFHQGTSLPIKDIDEHYHLWTIQDAKDGDVLACYSEVKGKPIEQVGIYKQYICRLGGCSNAFLTHTGIDWDGNIIINGYMGSTNILPATKEQRDQFFKKMKEAGYQWDADKKELHKIQPHYDIKNFHAGMPVLVRDHDNSRWSYAQFSHYVEEYRMKFNACGISYIQCIPYNNDTKHLLGTTDMCDEQYVNW